MYVFFFLSLQNVASERRTDAEAFRGIIGLPTAAVRGAWRGLDN